jgi:hydroxypyruvate reductase
MLEADQFLTRSLRSFPDGRKISRILKAAVSGADPEVLLRNALKRTGERLEITGRNYSLPDFDRIFLLAVGKAAVPMARTAASILKPRIQTGLVVSHQADQTELQNSGFEIINGDHPLPDQNSLNSGHRVMNFVSQLKAGDLLLVLLSGGGSALLAAPQPGLTLADLQLTYQALLNSGADIADVNIVRKHLSTIKGGNLAASAHPASIISLILSDVYPHPLNMVASGPTFPDPSTFQEAANVIAKYQMESSIPGSVRNHIKRGLEGQIPETLKPGDPVFERITNLEIGSNRNAVRAAISQADQEGLTAIKADFELAGEARTIGLNLARVLQELSLKRIPDQKPLCLVAGGETTVTLDQNRSGLGGRNLELALAAVKMLGNLQNSALVTLATDGIDGSSNAAGAVVTGDTLQRARHLSLDPDLYLRNHDSYHFFQELDDLIITGPTLTNVNDICVLICS